jgi:hypothetical protein
MALQPLENIPDSHRKKMFGPRVLMKIMGGNKIKHLLIILEAKLRLYVSI